MKKILYTATVDSHISSFHLPFIGWLKNKGYEIHVGSKGEEDMLNVDFKHNIIFERSPFKFNNYKAYKQLKKIINENQFELIHCNTPTASVITRLAARKARGEGTKVIYTAHGFHFHKGAPLINWLIYYPIEWFFAKYADAIITINKEDYNSAKKFFLKNAAKTYLIPGVGVDNELFSPKLVKNKDVLNKELGLEQSDFLLVYAAEINSNKDQKFLIDALEVINKKYPEIKLLLSGEGVLKESLEKYVKQKSLDNTILFLGYRNDLPDLIPLCDIGVSASQREGLGMNIIEYGACGLPVIATRNRGHMEIIINGYNGYLFEKGNHKEFIELVEKMYFDKEARMVIGRNGIKSSNDFSIEKAIEIMKKIYKIYI